MTVNKRAFISGRGRTDQGRMRAKDLIVGVLALWRGVNAPPKQGLAKKTWDPDLRPAGWIAFVC